MPPLNPFDSPRTGNPCTSELSPGNNNYDSISTRCEHNYDSANTNSSAPGPSPLPHPILHHNTRQHQRRLAVSNPESQATNDATIPTCLPSWRFATCPTTHNTAPPVAIPLNPSQAPRIAKSWRSKSGHTGESSAANATAPPVPVVGIRASSPHPRLARSFPGVPLLSLRLSHLLLLWRKVNPMSPPNDPAQQRQGWGGLHVPETNDAPPVECTAWFGNYLWREHGDLCRPAGCHLHP